MVPKRLLLTGASGFVAGGVVCQAGDEWEVHALSRQPSPVSRPHIRWHTTDILDFAQLRLLFEQIAPAAVIHAAGIADVDFCENHHAEADRANVELTREVAVLCRSSSARLIYTSTDTVFDGDKGNYVESDRAEPVNYYGRTKLRGEEAVMQTDGQWVIARLAIVMGLPFLQPGNSFLSRLLEGLAAGREMPVPAEEIRTPVDLVTLGRSLLELAGNSFNGIIHLAGNDRLHRLDASRQIAERFGHPPSQVVASSAAALPGRARRPVDVSLVNQLARTTLHTPSRGLLDGLELVLATSRSPG